MQGSGGAVSAAQHGRGSRQAAFSTPHYDVILAHLPSGRTTLNTVFLHADVKARPYRIADFRDTLARLALLLKVEDLGAYQMNHVWAVTFKNVDGAKKMLAATDVKVKGERCLVIDPSNQDLRIKLYWLLHNVPDEDVKFAMAPFGKVTDISREWWRVQGYTDKGSTTRCVSLKLKLGMTAEDALHQLHIAGDLALVVVPGRAPLCLRYHRTGHIRRECRVPRCSVCRRFGHGDTQCTKTYAAVAGFPESDALSEHTMDAADAREAAGEKNETSSAREIAATSSRNSCSPDETSSTEKTLKHDAPAGTSGNNMPASAPEKQPAKDEAPATPGDSPEEAMEIATGSAVTKSVHEEDAGDGPRVGPAGTAEPPPTTTHMRRNTLRPKLNVSAGRKPTTEQPPLQRPASEGMDGDGVATSW